MFKEEKGRREKEERKERKNIMILKIMEWGHLIKNGKINIESTPNNFVLHVFWFHFWKVLS